MRPGRCVQSGGSGDDCAACCNVGTDHDGPPQDYRDIASPPPAATARGPYTGPHPDDVREACEAAKAPPAATASDPREPGTPDGRAWRDLALSLRAERDAPLRHPRCTPWRAPDGTWHHDPECIVAEYARSEAEAKMWADKCVAAVAALRAPGVPWADRVTNALATIDAQGGKP